MELYRLDENYQPADLIENYSSLVWSERYDQSGDFVFDAYNISESINAIPLESTLAIRESTVPMRAEVHKIIKEKNAPPKVQIIGRSFEVCALERRASLNMPLGNTAPPVWNITAGKESDAAYKMLRIVLGDTEQEQEGLPIFPELAPGVDPLDAIPDIELVMAADFLGLTTWSSTVNYSINEVVCYNDILYKALQSNNTNQTPSTQPTYWQAYLYPSVYSDTTVYDYGDVVSSSSILYTSLVSGNLGKTPGSFPDLWKPISGTGQVYTIERGNLYDVFIKLVQASRHGVKAVRPVESTDNKIRIEIYNGADLSNTLTFNARFDQIDSANYLLSFQGSTNVAYVLGKTQGLKVLKTTDVEPTGMKRRVLYVDQTTDDSVNNPDSLKSIGLVALYQNNATALFDGQVADQIAEGYNRDYFLGDILRLDGEYGISRYVRVTEFIRSYDDTGEKAYPTLEAVEV